MFVEHKGEVSEVPPGGRFELSALPKPIRFWPTLVEEAEPSPPALPISQMLCEWGFVPSTCFDLHYHIDKSKRTFYLFQPARVCYRLNSGYGLKSFPGVEYSTLSLTNTWKRRVPVNKNKSKENSELHV